MVIKRCCSGYVLTIELCQADYVAHQVRPRCSDPVLGCDITKQAIYQASNAEELAGLVGAGDAIVERGLGAARQGVSLVSCTY